MNNKIALVVAMSKNRVIGVNNSLPWRLPSDLKRFKALTTGKVIIMGRRTFESIGLKPLPERMNFVITKNEELANKFVFEQPNLFVFTALLPALSYAAQIERTSEEIMVIGGSTLYKECLPLANRIYLTTVGVECAGDTFFPEEFDRDNWQCKSSEEVVDDPKSYLLGDATKQTLSYGFEVLERGTKKSNE